ncbi:MAG: hypothetical protein KKD44_14035 [Proteobacteria bacterium]|nr:hypothetical protein [Pseudomonadota bacterium]
METSETYSRLFQSTNLTVKPESLETIYFFVSGDIYANLNRHANENEGSIMDSYDDTDAFLYEAYACLNNTLPSLDIKMGRQYVTYQFSTHMDGLSTEYHFSDHKGLLYAYLGQSVDLYQFETWTDSTQAGTGLTYLLGDKAELCMEYLYIHEKTDNSDTLITPDENFHQASFSLKGFWDTGTIGATLKTFDNDMESARLRASFVPGAFENLDITASYYYQFIDISQRASALSPFITLLGPVKPYQQVSFQIIKGFDGPNIVIAGGGDWRDLIDANTDSAFNHSFVHGYLSMEKSEFLFTDLSLTVQGDIWQSKTDTPDSANGDDRIVSGGGELDYQWNEKSTLGLGSYYSLYKYDYYSDLNEKTDVYTLFTKIKYLPTDSIRLNAEYQLDIYDIHEHSVRLSTEWQF